MALVLRLRLSYDGVCREWGDLPTQSQSAPSTEDHMEQRKRKIVGSQQFVHNMQAFGGPIWDRYVSDNDVVPFDPQSEQRLQPIIRDLETALNGAIKRKRIAEEEVSHSDLVMAAMAIESSQNGEWVAPVNSPQALQEITKDVFRSKGFKHEPPQFTDPYGSMELEQMGQLRQIDIDDKQIAYENQQETI